MKKQIFLIILLILGITVFLPAEPEDDDSLGDLDDFDSLFEDDAEIEEIEEDPSVDLSSELLEDETGVRWSGRFTGNIDSSFSWYNFIDEGFFRETDAREFDTEVGAVLRFNARPDKNFRVSGKFTINTTLKELGLIVDGDAGLYDGTLIYKDLISVDELFTDFNYREKIFFRFGKSFIKWGKGYFWSPADILNLSSINAEDPTAEREGPINLKINYPFGANNIYLYFLLQDVDAIEKTGIAANMEFVIGDFEFGLGGFYQYERKPRIVGTFSGSIKKVGIFGEAALSFGSEKTLLRETSAHTSAVPDLETYTKDWEPVFFGTVGAMYINTDHDYTIIGQYYFNGEGHKNTEYDNGYSMLEYATYNVLPMVGTMSVNDLINFGQHYLGLSVMFTEIGGSDFSVSLYTLLSMSDWSGISAATLAWEVFDRAIIKLTPRVLFGQDGDEYLPVTETPNPIDPFSWLQQPVFQFTLSFSMGEDEF